MGKCLSREVRLANVKGEVNKSFFALKQVVGKGSFGYVWKAEKKSNRFPYAIKIMSKATVYNKRCVDTVMNEMKLLSSLKHPFIVNMQYAFQERDSLYLVTDFMPGGDLRYHINLRNKKFSERQAQFILACIILALEYLHNNGVIHRDLRPENILFDGKGYCKLTDYGLARVWQPQNSSDTSGTPGYCAPEVLLRQNHGTAVDYFALGIIAHELMLGKKPYAGDDRNSYKENLLKEQVVLKKADTPESWNHEASDFINKCIIRKPTSRLGLNGPAEIKSHVWFKDFDWQGLLARKLPSPYTPKSQKQNFDRKSFTIKKNDIETPAEVKMNGELLRRNSIQALFDGFQYDADEEKRREIEQEEAEKKQRNREFHAN